MPTNHLTIAPDDRLTLADCERTRDFFLDSAQAEINRAKAAVDAACRIELIRRANFAVENAARWEDRAARMRRA